MVAVIIGIGVALVFNKLDKNIIATALSPSVTYFSVGTYNDLEMAKSKKNNYEEAIIYNDKGLYKVIIGVYSNPDTTLLMRSYFKDQNYTFSEDKMKMSNEFINSIENFELLIKSSDKSYYESLNKSILEVFSRMINS